MNTLASSTVERKSPSEANSKSMSALNWCFPLFLNESAFRKSSWIFSDSSSSPISAISMDKRSKISRLACGFFATSRRTSVSSSLDKSSKICRLASGFLATWQRTSASSSLDKTSKICESAFGFDATKLLTFRYPCSADLSKANFLNVSWGVFKLLATALRTEGL